MRVIDVRNVHEALPAGIALLKMAGIPAPTRGGECIVLPGPCTTIYRKPTERVLFWPERDANPFFHFFEGLWMLAGRNDVEFVARFAKRMATFSDDGTTLHGAYGHRWRHPIDQLDTLVDLLRTHPRTRRAVLQMWRAKDDLFDHEDGHKDVPCNTSIYFWRAEGAETERLHMTVTCRSNDIIWGAYGANAVHMSMLHEYMAARVGVEVGYYWQISNNYHAYTDVMNKVGNMLTEINPYENVEPYPMVGHPLKWDIDLLHFLDDHREYSYFNRFFYNVADHLMESHIAYKDGRLEDAISIAGDCEATDWRKACMEWLERRRK